MRLKCEISSQENGIKGFSPKWISWVKSFISGGSVAVNVNDDVGSYFQMKKAFDKEILDLHYSNKER
jgi:hypothetical protein